MAARRSVNLKGRLLEGGDGKRMPGGITQRVEDSFQLATPDPS